ncbi:MAG: hypothetical protein ACTSQI_09375 [Candidatus Helarchaeota archaeon]
MTSIQDPHIRHIAQIVKVVNDILEAQTVILQRIEEGYKEHLSVYNELLNRIGLLDRKIEGGFTVMEKTRLASLDQTISNKLKKIEYGYLNELKSELDAVHTKLFQQVQTRMLQLLIQHPKQLQKLSTHKPREVGKPTLHPSAPIAPTTLVPEAKAYHTPKQPQTVAAVEGDWSESELEGATIFEAIITGWKRRDWEKVQGTKETFMRGWKKLSSVDRQKIKNGTWSKPIMKKIKLLGRE